MTGMGYGRGAGEWVKVVKWIKVGLKLSHISIFQKKINRSAKPVGHCKRSNIHDIGVPKD